MKNIQVLCVDFGSAYTKVALRSRLDDLSVLIRDVPLASRDASFCIPSVVARVQRPGGAKWSVGEAAYAQAPGHGVKVYQHWKASLMSDEVTEENTEVGVIFFKELRETLRKMGLTININSCPVRVCIPKLKNSSLAIQRMQDILSKAGWSPGQKAETVYEPESNVIGIFTQGRNAAWQPELPSSPRIYPYYARMFDPEGLFGAFRHAALTGRNMHYGVLVLDIGAFTTDFGYIEFDTSFYDDEAERPEVIQVSRRIGIRELDELVKNSLAPAAKDMVEKSAAIVWEIGKRQLYSGKPWAVRNPKGGKFIIGNGSEASEIADTVSDFAKNLVKAKVEFCRDHVKGPIDAAVLTGGGAMIPLVRKALRKAMNENGKIRFFDLLDDNRPNRVRRWQDGTWGWYDSDRDIELEQKKNQELVRSGSAIGGCSVFFEG